MSEKPTATAEPASQATAGADEPGQPGRPGEVLVEDVLVEEVSIDGMCGVY